MDAEEIAVIVQQVLENPINPDENAEITANISDEDDFQGFNDEE